MSHNSILKINMPDITNDETLRYIYTVIVISKYLQKVCKENIPVLFVFMYVWRTRDNKDKMKHLSRRLL